MTIEDEGIAEKKRRELVEEGQLTERKTEMEVTKFLIREIDKLQADYNAQREMSK